MKIKKEVVTKILSSLTRKGFPKFKVKAIEYQNGRIEGKVLWMKTEIRRTDNDKYVLKNEFLLHTKEFYEHRKEFDEHRKEFDEHRKEFAEFKIDVSDQFKEVNKRIDNLETKMDNGFKDIHSKFDELKQLIINKQ